MAGKMQLLWHKHGNKILTMLSVLGTTATVVSAIKNTEKHLNRPAVGDKKTRIKTTLADYASTMALYGATTAITVVNGVRNEKIMAAYSTALISANTALQKYREGIVKRENGEKLDAEIMNDVVNNLPIDDETIEIAKRGSGFNKIYFPAGHRVWYGSIEAIDDALRDCWTIIHTKGFCTFNDLYDQLGISKDPHGYDYCWTEDFRLDIYPLIDQYMDEAVIKVDIAWDSQPVATNIRKD